jgi:hypothetical protein
MAEIIPCVPAEVTVVRADRVAAGRAALSPMNHHSAHRVALPMLAARPCALLLVLAPALPVAAQETAAGGSIETDRYRFVLRGGELRQFDRRTGELLRTRTLRVPATGEVHLPTQAQPRPRDPGLPDPFVDSIEIELPQGRYADRITGRERLGLTTARPTAEAIGRGLAWLCARQHPDGHWAPVPAREELETTALAMLARCGDGHTLRSGECRRALKRAVIWLRDRQDRGSGRFAVDGVPCSLRAQAIASLAMLETYGMSDYRVLRQDAQRSIDCLRALRAADGLWSTDSGARDPVVTSWCMQAWAAARDFGLRVDERIPSAVAAWIANGAATDHRTAARQLLAGQLTGLPATRLDALAALVESHPPPSSCVVHEAGGPEVRCSRIDGPAPLTFRSAPRVHGA